MPGLKNRCRGWNQMPKALQRGEAGTRCRRRYSGGRYHSGGFLLRAMPPSWHPVPACVRYGILQAKPFSLAATKNRIGRGPRSRYDHSRRNHSLLPQRKLESDADLVAAMTTVGGPFLTAAAMTLHRFPSLALKSRIDARNRAETGKSLHRFASLALKSRIDAHRMA